MPEAASDPRVYFAAERTLLAWLRTGVAVMAFGFVVARFGVLLGPMPIREGAGGSQDVSVLLGTTLVGLGVVATAGGALQYHRFCRTLPPGDRPATSGVAFVLGVSWALALLGAVLGLVLVM